MSQKPKIGNGARMPSVVYIEPHCEKCTDNPHEIKWHIPSEITWCEDNVYDDCPECGMKPGKFVKEVDIEK